VVEKRNSWLSCSLVTDLQNIIEIKSKHIRHHTEMTTEHKVLNKTKNVPFIFRIGKE
jgi:hypothetical protein